MRTVFFTAILVLAGGLLVKPGANAQGTVYVSNLGYPASGSLSVGGNAWVATWFQTGSFGGGYILDSIQLSMAAPLGSPSGFAVMLWDFQRDQSIATLAGRDPLSAGVFSYTASNVSLAPRAVYWFVVTSTTPVETGAFRWNYVAPGSYPGTDLWMIGGAYQKSSDGIQWSRAEQLGAPQFAVYATPIPEPTALALFGLGVFFFAAHLLGSHRAKPYGKLVGTLLGYCLWTWASGWTGGGLTRAIG